MSDATEPIKWPDLGGVVADAIAEALDGIAFVTGMVTVVSIMTREGVPDLYVVAQPEQSSTVSIGLTRQAGIIIEGSFAQDVGVLTDGPCNDPDCDDCNG